MEIIQVVGVDPSLRFTGIAKVSYNTETAKFSVSCCQVIQNKTTLKGTEAIVEMLNRLEKVAQTPEMQESDIATIESPVVPFNLGFQASSMISVAHIAGGASALFGIEKTKLYRPSEWNRSKKKEVTHALVQQALGSWQTWGWSVVARRKDHIEHVLDAVSMAYYHIQKNFVEGK